MCFSSFDFKKLSFEIRNGKEIWYQSHFSKGLKSSP